MGIHLSGVLALVFINFPLRRGARDQQVKPNRWWRYANVPLYDWIFVVLGVAAALYIGVSWYGFDFEIFGFHYFLTEQSLRQGDPRRYRCRVRHGF